MIGRAVRQPTSRICVIGWRRSTRACCTSGFRTGAIQCRLFGASVRESLEMVNSIPSALHLRGIGARVVAKSKEAIEFLLFRFIFRRVLLCLSIEIECKTLELVGCLDSFHQMLDICMGVRSRDFGFLLQSRD